MTTQQQRPDLALPSEFVIRNACVLTMDPQLGELPSGDIHIRNGEIVAVGHQLSCPGGITEVSGEDLIALPGFVDTHWHLWNSALRGLVRGDDSECGYFPVTLKLGPGTPNGRTFRVRGRGVHKNDGSTGDLLVTVEVQVPNQLNDTAKEALESFAAALDDADPRSSLYA